MLKKLILILLVIVQTTTFSLSTVNAEISPSGASKAYAYNRANLVTALTNLRGYELLSSFAYTYYLDGNQRQIVENTGRITTYTYDGLGRLTSETQVGGDLPGIAKAYTFDTAGNRASMTVTGDENFTTTYYYDQNNRLLQEVKIEGNNEPVVTIYIYDANGNQVSRTVTGGQDGDPGQQEPPLTPITASNLTITAPATGATPSQTAGGVGNFTISNITWSATGATFEPNTVYSVWITLTANEGHTFAGLNAPAINGNNAVIVSNTGTTLIVSFEFPATLEIPNIPPEDVELQVFLNYEELFDGWWTSILVSWIGEGFPLEWEVSPCNSVITGEATLEVDDPYIFYVVQDEQVFWLYPQDFHAHPEITLSVPTTAGVLTKSFQVDVVNLPPVARGFAFEAVNLEDGVTTTYTYDVFNRLIGVTNSDLTAYYSYRPDGLRITKTVDGTRTTHIWDGANIVAELDNENEIKDVYIRGIGLIRNGQNQWFLFNARGDVVALTDSTGNVIREYRYDAFGNEFDLDPYDTNPWRFVGEYFDRETGMYYLRARFYNPRTGRFITEDPIRDHLNWYTYCINNPIMFIDPSGLYHTEGQRSVNEDFIDRFLIEYEVLRVLEMSQTEYLFLTDIAMAMQFTLIQRVELMEIYRDNALLVPLQQHLQGMGHSVSSSKDWSWHIHMTYIAAADGSALGNWLQDVVVLGVLDAGAGKGTGVAGGQSNATTRNSGATPVLRIRSNAGNVYDISPSRNHIRVTGDPTIGRPNSSADIINRQGISNKMRWYGSDGRAVRDIHFDNHGNPLRHPEVPHQQFWDWSNPNGPRLP